MKNKILHHYLSLISIFDRIFAPFALLAARVKIASIFWNAGISKIQSWPTTLYLFAHEYKVPFLPTKFAALSATGFELCCPVLLVIGFGARLASIPLMVMTAVIEFTYMSFTEHVYWFLLLFLILSCGPSKISLDHLIKRKYLQVKFR